MSTNNILVIKEYTGSPRYRLSDECVECNPTYESFDNAETLEDAIIKANKYMREEVVEYGLSIDLIKKKII